MGSLSHTPIQATRKFYLQNIPRIQMLYNVSTATTLVQATILSFLDFYNSLSMASLLTPLL